MSDLAIIASDPSALDLSGDPATFVVLACERAKDWLTQAVEHGDIDQIVELKSQAEAIRIYTTQKQLGKDAELAAAEIVRRAERGIGVAIRRGQEEGTIRRAERHGVHDANSMSPQEAVGAAYRSELSDVYYPVTDDVTDKQFEEAIEEAKAEQNLSRVNVVRKVKPNSSASRHLRSSRPEILRGRRHFDSNRAVEQIILGSGMSDSVAELIEYDALDRDRLEGWVSSLSEVIKSLQTLNNNLKKELTQ